jgi:hypothetical protein
MINFASCSSGHLPRLISSPPRRVSERLILYNLIRLISQLLGCKLGIVSQKNIVSRDSII